MKKILCALIIICLMLPCVFGLAGCFGKSWHDYYVDINSAYNNLNSICGDCSNTSDTLAVNNSYSLELTTSTYTD